MRKLIGLLLVGLGGFLVVIALLGALWFPGQVMKTPLNTDTKTYLTGSGEKLDSKTGKPRPINVKVMNWTRVDTKKSDKNVVVFLSTQCVNIDVNDPPQCLRGNDPRLVSNSVDTFAENRKTGMAVNEPRYMATGSVPHQGLINKWPFNTQKHSYPFWNSVMQTPVTATYVREQTMSNGLKAYVFHVKVPPTKTLIAAGTSGVYSLDSTITVDPVTGAILNQEQHEVRKLPDGTTAVDLAVHYTPEQVDTNIADAKANVANIQLVTKIVPVVGGVVGVLLLILGLVLVVLTRRKHKQMQEQAEDEDED